MKEQWHNYIDQYYRDQLSREEKGQFEEKKAEDPAFAQAVEDYLQERAVIAQLAKERLLVEARGLLHQSDQKIKKETKVIAFSWKKWSIAASFLVLLSAGVLWLNSSSPLSNEELFAQYYEPSLMSSSRSTETTSDAWNEAVDHYMNGDFESAIQDLKEYISQDTGSTEQAKFFMGLSHLELAHFDQAIQVFKSVNQASTYYPNAVWHLALTYLKQGKVEKAKTEFQQIVEEGAYKSDEAASILKALK